MTEWKGGGTAWKNVAGREKIISGIVMFMAWAHSHLPPERYASKSMRVGFASGSKFIGVKDDLVKKRGGWSKNSNVPSQYYTKGKETGGLLAWSTGKDLMSVKDVKKMV
jgi:hypothetical protein